jgi:hypothetical protein
VYTGRNLLGLAYTPDESGWEQGEGNMTEQIDYEGLDQQEITRSLQEKPRLADVFGMNRSSAGADPKHNLMVVIIVLLAIQILLSGYQIFHDIIRDQREAREKSVLTSSVASYTQNLDELTNKMLDDYKASIYNNSQVDTTSKQVVMGTEYNFNAIMLLIKQNSRLMELIAESK